LSGPSRAAISTVYSPSSVQNPSVSRRDSEPKIRHRIYESEH
jgi:hypothetical protein